jgi:hypothetical protein
MDRYKLELDAKTEILEILLDRFNDGRKKSFYCLAANLWSLKIWRTYERRLTGWMKQSRKKNGSGRRKHAYTKEQRSEGLT